MTTTYAETKAAAETLAITEDAFLGGRLTLAQPAKGYRAGIDAVMLAAAVPARAGERVIEAGCGVGVAALCLASRVDAVCVTGVEVEPALAALARDNAQRNGIETRVTVRTGDVTAGRNALSLDADSFDHAMANPPFHEAGRTRVSGDLLKARSHVFGPDDLDAWVRFLVSVLRPRGTLTLVHRADALPAILKAFERRLGACRVLPLHPRVGEPASRIIVQAEKGSRSPLALLPGVVLHGDSDGFTTQADEILRHGAALPLG